MQHPGGGAYFCLCVCFVLLVLFSLETIEAYKLHKLREWTKSIGGKGRVFGME